MQAYGLDTDYTNSYITIPASNPGIVSVAYGFRVYLVTSSTTETELTSGSPQAVINIYDSYVGQISTSWSCPSKTITLGYNALKVVVYISFNNGSSWSAQATYISNVLITKKLDASQWQFNLDLNVTQTDQTYSSFSFGSTDYRSGISNVKIEKPFQSEIQLWRINRGDYVGFEVGAYTDIIGEAFYALLLFLFASVLYFRYGHFGTVAFFFVLFGGMGGLAWLLVPPWAAAVVSALVIIGTSFLVWRVIR